jgi:hypothetical protein
VEFSARQATSVVSGAKVECASVTPKEVVMAERGNQQLAHARPVSPPPREKARGLPLACTSWVRVSPRGTVWVGFGRGKKSTISASLYLVGAVPSKSGTHQFRPPLQLRRHQPKWPGIIILLHRRMLIITPFDRVGVVCVKSGMPTMRTMYMKQPPSPPETDIASKTKRARRC